MVNPYGNGNASETIVRVLTTVSLSEQLLIKQASPLGSQWPEQVWAECMAHMRIPLFVPDITEAEIQAVVNVLRTPQLSLDPQLEAFEQAMANYVDASHAVAVNSGTSGLHLCMRCLGIGKADEVIVPSFTFIAAANVIRMEHAVPV